MATYRQVVDEIRNAPGFATSLGFKENEQRIFANAAALEERLNDRFQQAFTEVTATLSSKLITQPSATKQVDTQPTIPVGGNDTLVCVIMGHNARSTQNDRATLDHPYRATHGPSPSDDGNPIKTAR
jgi:hypothetical protein